MKLSFGILPLFFCLSFSQADPTKLTVLTYSSMLDKGGMGEWINSQRREVEFIAAKDFSGMLGQLRRLKRQNKLASLSVVMGLNETNYLAAKAEGLVDTGVPFEKSSYALLANTQTLPEAKWPKNWEDLAKNFQKKILIQDPRTSEVGLAWLLNAVKLKNLSLPAARDLPLKSFPKWSSSFTAFESGMAPLLWTYASSVAYFECSGAKKPYANVPLANYPADTNYIAPVHGGHDSSAAAQFISFVQSQPAQDQLWQKNWMFAVGGGPAPNCFQKAEPRSGTQKITVQNSADIIKWLDEWSL